MSLIQFRLTMSFSTSSMADLPSFSTEEFYWLASCFWGIITCKLVVCLVITLETVKCGHFGA
ncbi:hypothetical protein ES319_A06G000600v1 [Gossypium barbadense]|uniref:Uncharacterized protein n=3 Tax=Gossypium TaxID=3633 RepID=A0A5J5V836_GOSBA|nr:hypothetical protein ES319_A06G000600v1 [Gossypium barbadense]TYH11644.1 hypothetical protein ES288_A06G001400v1 [Gossypium darwinii]TYI20928.1 hypothetical protein ES332_A06G000600v1 [Gossypium tomentosum]